MEEVRTAAEAPTFGEGWGTLDAPGPVMLIAEMRGAAFVEYKPGDWARPNDTRSRKILHAVSDELAEALGYIGDYDLWDALRKRPNEVRDRLIRLAKRKTLPAVGVKCCPECQRPW